MFCQPQDSESDQATPKGKKNRDPEEKKDAAGEKSVEEKAVTFALEDESINQAPEETKTFAMSNLGAQATNNAGLALPQTVASGPPLIQQTQAPPQGPTQAFPQAGHPQTPPRNTQTVLSTMQGGYLPGTAYVNHPPHSSPAPHQHNPHYNYAQSPPLQNPYDQYGQQQQQQQQPPSFAFNQGTGSNMFGQFPVQQQPVTAAYGGAFNAPTQPPFGSPFNSPVPPPRPPLNVNMDLIKKMGSLNVLPKRKVEDGTDPTKPIITHLTGRSQTLVDDFCVTYLPDKTVGGQEYETFIVDRVAGGDFEFITATVPLSGTAFPNVEGDVSRRSMLLAYPKERREKRHDTFDQDRKNFADEHTMKKIIRHREAIHKNGNVVLRYRLLVWPENYILENSLVSEHQINVKKQIVKGKVGVDVNIYDVNEISTFLVHFEIAARNLHKDSEFDY